jgi:hypothetical protein
VLTVNQRNGVALLPGSVAEHGRDVHDEISRP